MNKLWLTWSLNTRKLVWALFLGQVISLMFALASLCSSLIAQEGVDAPIFQGLFNYLLLAVVCGGIMLYRGQKLMAPWYWYLPLGFVDVHANYFFNLAFHYTSMTTVTLLNCWTIAWVIGLTWLCLGTRYTFCQFLGAAICVSGLALVVLSDAGTTGVGGTRPLLGDILIITATTFFALSNVGEEFLVKRNGAVEVLTMMGLFGALVSICGICIFETEVIESVAWSSELILAGCGYTLAAFVLYLLMPHVMQSSGSALFNLSLLTSDMWAVVFRLIFYNQKVNWLYYVSFGVVTVGLVIYTKSEKDPELVPIDDEDANYQIIDVESVNEDLKRGLLVGNTST